MDLPIPSYLPRSARQPHGLNSLRALIREIIVPAFEKVRGKELIIFGDHEQYFFKDYFAYQPDYVEKILVAAKWLKENGYKFLFIEDAVA